MPAELTDVNEPPGGNRRWALVAVAVFATTVVQLVAATFFAGQLPQFAGKGFGARLVAYPAMMAVVPVTWVVRRRLRGGTAAPPWGGFALIMSPFLIDVTGNTVNLYDTVSWWDDVNHFVNWLLLCSGIGVLMLRSRVQPAWAVGLVVAGIGGLLAIGWELGEWYTFIRHGTELGTAYTDTLGDEALGSLGGVIAALLVTRHASRRAGLDAENR